MRPWVLRHPANDAAGLNTPRTAPKNTTITLIPSDSDWYCPTVAIQLVASCSYGDGQLIAAVAVGFVVRFVPHSAYAPQMIESGMPPWTEQEIIDQLNRGWVLEGDIDSDEPFTFIYPLTHSPAKPPFPAIPSAMVRSLADAGEIVPSPGPTLRYWKLRS